MGELAFLRINIVPATKLLGADLLEFAAPEIAEVSRGQKKLKTAAKSVGGQTLRKKLDSDCRKITASRLVPANSAKQTSRSRRDFSANISP